MIWARGAMKWGSPDNRHPQPKSTPWWAAPWHGPKGQEKTGPFIGKEGLLYPDTEIIEQMQNSSSSNWEVAKTSTSPGQRLRDDAEALP